MGMFRAVSEVRLSLPCSCARAELCYSQRETATHFIRHTCQRADGYNMKWSSFDLRHFHLYRPCESFTESPMRGMRRFIERDSFPSLPRPEPFKPDCAGLCLEPAARRDRHITLCRGLHRQRGPT